MIKKLILLAALFAGGFVFSAAPVRAVTKTSGDLEVTFDEPMFVDAAVWYPGLSVTKSVTVKNKGNSGQTVSMEAVNKTQAGKIAQTLFFKVLEGDVNRYGGANDKTLQNFWDDGPVSLSVLAGGATVTYDLTVKMAASSGNEYQGKEARFDLWVGFLEAAAGVTSGGGGGGSAAAASGGGLVVGSATGFAPGVLGSQENLGAGRATASSELVRVLGAREASWWETIFQIIRQMLQWLYEIFRSLFAFVYASVYQ